MGSECLGVESGCSLSTENGLTVTVTICFGTLSQTRLHADMFNLMEPHAEPEKVKLRINQWNDVHTSRSHANPYPR